MPILLLLLAGWGVPVQTEPLSLLQTVLTAKELQGYVQEYSYPKRIQVLRRLLDHRMRQVTRLVRIDSSEKVVEPVRAMSIIASEGARLTAEVTEGKKLRSRQSRRLEIHLRKMLEKLKVLRRGSSHQVWDEFDVALEEVRNFRSSLLDGFFTGYSFPAWEEEYLQVSLSFSTGISPLHRIGQRLGRRQSPGDQFTNEEYDRVQNAQKLKRRLKVFRDIASSRSSEIERRLEKRVPSETKANPLRFYTYAQLVRAYWRAIHSSMINIEEKASDRSTPDEDIQKALKALGSDMQTFIPILEPLRQIALDMEDENFHLEWREAWRFSQSALRGSEIGLEKLSEREK
jgi:hypothetical protein